MSEIVPITPTQAFLLYSLSRINGTGQPLDPAFSGAVLHLLADHLLDCEEDIDKARELYNILPKISINEKHRMDFSSWVRVFEEKEREKLMDREYLFCLNRSGYDVGTAINNDSSMPNGYRLEEKAQDLLTPYIRSEIDSKAQTYKNMSLMDVVLHAKTALATAL